MHASSFLVHGIYKKSQVLGIVIPDATECREITVSEKKNLFTVVVVAPGPNWVSSEFYIYRLDLTSSNLMGTG